MKELFILDKKDYKEDGTVFIRPSVRGIIIRNNKVAMVYSQKFKYYKFPGGGINAGESHFQALLREVEEETGLILDEKSIKDYGLVIRKQKGKIEDIFIQHNYYYTCDIKTEHGIKKLDDYELDEGFILKWVTIEEALSVNNLFDHDDEQLTEMVKRDSMILKML